MKVRIDEFNKLNRKQRDAIDKYVKERGLEIYQQEAQGDFRRYYKLVAVALNITFGFGKNRISKLFDEISSLSNQRDSDDVFWAHIDKVVINQIGLDFEKEPYSDLDP